MALCVPAEICKMSLDIYFSFRGVKKVSRVSYFCVTPAHAVYKH